MVDFRVWLYHVTPVNLAQWKVCPSLACVNISDDNKSLCKHWPVSIRDAQKKDDAKSRKHKVEEGIFGKDIQFTSEHIRNLIK